MQSLLTFICPLQVGAICVEYSCSLKKKNCCFMYLGLLQLHDYPSMLIQIMQWFTGKNLPITRIVNPSSHRFSSQ